MSWASGRRTLIIGIIAGVLLIVLGLFLYFSLQKAPTCEDRIMNQGEEGIDCGGPCTYLCENALRTPAVSFVRALTHAGRTDIIAYIENPNDAAARSVPYSVELYGEGRTVLAKRSGTMDVPPRSYGPTPLYIPGVYTGEEQPAQAFLMLEDNAAWFALSEPLLVPVADSPILEEGETPRVTAVFTNEGVDALRRVKVIATVFDAEGNAMAASQTVLPDLAPGATAEAVFTWNEPFAAAVARLDVRPILAVPAP